MAGAESKIFPVEGCTTAIMALLPEHTRKRAAVVPAAGHWLYLERPREFAALLRAFLV